MNQKGFMFKKNSEYRPGSLGGSVKLVLAAFMALAFVVALSSSAMAELKIDGQFSAAFGQYSSEDTDNDGTGGATQTRTKAEGFRNDSQAQINFTGSGDNGTAKLRLRVREDGGGSLAAYRHHIYWNVNDQLKIGWWGVGFGLGAALVGYSVNGGIGTMGDGTPIGDQWGGLATFANAQGLDVSFTTGGMNVGVAILDHCVPSCEYEAPGVDYSAAGAGAGTGSADTNTMTLVPYFKGSFGALTVGAFLTSASGDNTSQVKSNSTDSQSLEASALDVAVVFTTGGMSIAAEIAQTTQSPNSELLTAAGVTNTADYGDIEGSRMGVGVKVAGLKARYSTVGATVSVGTVELEETSTEIAAAYTIPMGAVNLIPQFAQRSTESTISDAATYEDKTDSTYVAFGASASF